MATPVLANAAASTLASAVADGSVTSFTLVDGSSFPSPGAGQYVPVVVVDTSGPTVKEIVYCTARSGNVLTVTRAAEDAVRFPAGGLASGLLVQCAWTVQSFDDRALSATSATYATVVEHGSAGSTARPSGAVLVVWVGSATPANAATNDEWWNTTTSPAVFERFNGSTWDTVAGSSSTTVKSAHAKRTAGNVVIGATTFTAVDTGTDLTLAAAVGDVLSIAPNALWNNDSAQIGEMDVATVVSGSTVNFVSGNTRGVSGWSGQSSVYVPVGPPLQYTVVAGDLSGGNVTLRLMARVFTTGSRTLFASSASYELYFSAVNLGH